MQIATENTSRGRAFFVLPIFGEYTVVVEAVGYKLAQKDVFDVNFVKDSDASSVAAFEKGLQATGSRFGSLRWASRVQLCQRALFIPSAALPQ
jgi:hypothetical protein